MVQCRVSNTYSEVGGGYIRVDAIRVLFPIFRKARGLKGLRLGALFLGLGEVADKREISLQG